MAKKKRGSCISPAGNTCGSCRIEAVTGIDNRGQVLLPKDLRDKAGMSPGDKLAIISWERDGEVCCVTLMRTNDLTESVKDILGPMMKDMSE